MREARGPGPGGRDGGSPPPTAAPPHSAPEDPTVARPPHPPPTQWPPKPTPTPPAPYGSRQLWLWGAKGPFRPPAATRRPAPSPQGPDRHGRHRPDGAGPRTTDALRARKGSGEGRARRAAPLPRGRTWPPPPLQYIAHLAATVTQTQPPSLGRRRAGPRLRQTRTPPHFRSYVSAGAPEEGRGWEGAVTARPFLP